MRGIVISPFNILGQNSIRLNDILAMRVRNYILYCDAIDIPVNNIVGYGLDKELEYLITTGVVRQTRVTISGSGEVTKLYMQGQMQVFEFNNNVDKGLWSLGQDNLDMVFPEEMTIKLRSLEVDLNNRLPIPSRLSSFDDILRYKIKRNDELLAFRALMDEFYLEILDSSDSERALQVKINKVLKSITEIEKTMSESSIIKFCKGMKVSLDIPAALKGAGLGTLFTNVVDMDSAIGAFVGGTSNLFNVEINDVFKPKKIPENLSDYAYLYYATQGYRL